MKGDIHSTPAKRDTLRKWMNVFLGVQLAVLIFKIAEFYRLKLSIFHTIAWAGLVETSTYSAVLFNALFALLSFWASPFLRKRNYSFMEAGCYGYLLFTSFLALLNYGVMYATKHFFPPINNAFLFALFIAGFANYSMIKMRLAAIRHRTNGEGRPGSGLYFWVVLIIGLTMLPFLILPYSCYDALYVYSLKAFAIKVSGGASAVCLGDGSFYPPLYPIILSLGMGDHLFEGRLMPFFMFLAFMVVFWHTLPRKGFIDRKFAVALFLSTPIIWLGVVSYLANITFMTLLGAAGFLLIKSRFSIGNKLTIPETVIATILLGAAALVREDGIIVIFALLLGISLLDNKVNFFRYVSAAMIVLALSLTWEFRPVWLRSAAGYFQKQDAVLAARMGYGFHFKTVLRFLYAAQGLYLSHYGFAVFFYGIITAFIAGIWNKIAFINSVRLYGLITAISLCAVAMEYLCLGLFFYCGMDYYVQVQLSFARSTMHFFPFMMLFLVTFVNACCAGTEEETNNG